MQPETTASVPAGAVEALFKAGAQYGYTKSKRHPSARPFIFGAKNRVEIFDLEKTAAALESAKEFVRLLASEGKTVLFVGGKHEARGAIKEAAEKLDMPYVASRWIGGTLTNYGEIRKRVARLEELTSAREKGELGKYTKKERLMFDREIEDLEKTFRGLARLSGMPAALFVVDPRKEFIAVTEAGKMRVPVIALGSTDSDFSRIDYAIPANDSAAASIKLIVGEIADAYAKNRREPVAVPTMASPSQPAA